MREVIRNVQQARKAAGLAGGRSYPALADYGR